MNDKKNAKNSEPAKTKQVLKDALVFIETRGKTGAISALDLMPKTSEVHYVNRHNIGSGLVTVIYEGEVAAANSARDASLKCAQGLGEVISSTVIPRPDARIYSLVVQRSGEAITLNSAAGGRVALGMIETEGFVPMIEAADAGIKAADVQIPSWVTVGSGLTTVFFRGEVAAVYAAVEEGCTAAEKIGKIMATHVIPQPHAGTNEAFPIAKVTGPSVFRKTSPEDALGILETKGIVGLIEGVDAGLKAASVVVQGWEKVGRGITSTLFRGTVADVKSAMDSAVSSASKVGEVSGQYIIARPHKELEKGR
jgi:carbon dioxide concentrating mechanism protein CcmO